MHLALTGEAGWLVSCQFLTCFIHPRCKERLSSSNTSPVLIYSKQGWTSVFVRRGDDGGAAGGRGLGSAMKGRWKGGGGVLHLCVKRKLMV